MKFKNPYWTVKTQLELLEKWILTHSCIYYELNQSIVTDQVFDNNCKQLITLSEAHPDDFKKSKWYYAFKDFDGSTGFDLYRRLKTLHRDDILNTALLTIKVARRKSHEVKKHR